MSEIDNQVAADEADVVAKQAALDANVQALASAKQKLADDQAAQAAQPVPEHEPTPIDPVQVPVIVSTNDPVADVLDEIETVVKAGVADVVQEVTDLVAKGKSLLGL